MGRVSQAQAQENRKRIVETASRLFREQGTHVSVADLMKAVGLTHGGFYKHFASKEALIDEATTYAFDELAERYRATPGSSAAQREVSRRTAVEEYLSVEHRDHAADGCPVAGLTADMARTADAGDAHRVYAEGVRDFARWLGNEDGTTGDDDSDSEAGFLQLCTMVGALVLSRATKDSPISEQILTIARAALTAED